MEQRKKLSRFSVEQLKKIDSFLKFLREKNLEFDFLQDFTFEIKITHTEHPEYWLKAHIFKRSSNDIAFTCSANSVGSGILSVGDRFSTFKASNKNLAIPSKFINDYILYWISLVNDKEFLLSSILEPNFHFYFKEAFDEFQLQDEDAHTQPFPFEKQVLIDDFSEKTIEIILRHQKNSEAPEEFDKIEIEIKDLKKKLPVLTKQQVVNRLAKIWAYMRKLGIDFTKELKSEAFKDLAEGIWGGLKGLLN